MKNLLCLFILFNLIATPVIFATENDESERFPFEPEMVEIQGGTFQMGCVSGKGCRKDELPVHEVTIKTFEMGKYEVTFDQWDECVKQEGCKHNPKDLWGRGKQPVLNIGRDDVQEYLAWLNEKTGKPYRLPTEAEWEYAARAGTQTPFYTGDCLNADQANYKGDFAWDEGSCPATDKYLRQTVEVGSFAANDFGLFDMYGNLGEWIQDCYHRDYEGAPNDGSAWETDCSEQLGRVTRGGTWLSITEQLRSPRRHREPPLPKGKALGLRVARTLD